MDYALTIENVTKRYLPFVLDDVTIRLQRGTIMGLIGENGAGKTTTLRLLLDLIRPESGSVSLLGETAPEAMCAAKARVGVVLDDGFFPASFRPAEIARVCRRIYPNWHDDVFDGWLQRLKLPRDKRIKELSKGMKMKLSIALALSHDAELLILDEATSGLDPIVRSEVLDVFQDFMQDERRAILFSTHITTDLERVADEIVFLHEGRVVMHQGMDEIRDSYGVLKCGQEAFDALDARDVVGYRSGAYGYEALLRDRAAYLRTHPDAVIDHASLDDVMLYTIQGRRIG